MIFMAGFIDCAFCSRCSGNLKICHMAGGRTASSWLRPAFPLSLSLSHPHCHPSHPSVALISPKVHRRTPIPSDSSLLFDSNSVAVCGVNVNMAYGRPWVYYLHYLSFILNFNSTCKNGPHHLGGENKHVTTFEVQENLIYIEIFMLD